MAKYFRIANWGVIEREAGHATAQALRRIVGAAGDGRGGLLEQAAMNVYRTTNIYGGGSIPGLFPLRVIGSPPPQIIIGYNDATIWNHGVQSNGDYNLDRGGTVFFQFTADGKLSINEPVDNGLLNINVGAGDAFDPSTLTGLYMWLLADDLSETEGQDITQWDDRSGVSNIAWTKQTGVEEPQVHENRINGYKSVYNDVAGRTLIIQAGNQNINASDSYTLAIVYYSPGLATHFIMGGGTGSTARGWRIPEADASGRTVCYGGAGNNNVADSFDNGSAGWRVAILRRTSGGDYSTMVNGDTSMTGSYNDSNYWTWRNLFRCSSNIGHWCAVNTEIAEMFLCWGAGDNTGWITDAERDSLSNYLLLKYGLGGTPAAGGDIALEVQNSDEDVLVQIDADGLVGIGTGATTDMDAKLHVEHVTAPQFRLAYDGTNELDISVASDGDTDFLVNDTKVFTITVDGDMGVGIDPPAARLHVLDTTLPQLRVAYDADSYLEISAASDDTAVFGINGTDIITIQATNNQFRVEYDSGNYFEIDVESDGDTDFRVDGNNIMTLVDSGEVGIGTTAPLELLHLQDAGDAIMRIEDTGSDPARIKLDADPGGEDAAVGRISGHVNGASAFARIEFQRGDNDNYGNIAFYTDDGSLTQRMVITQEGDVGIGTTDPQEKLHLQSTGDAIMWILDPGSDAGRLKLIGSTSSSGGAVGQITGHRGITGATSRISFERGVSDTKGQLRFAVADGSGLVTQMYMVADGSIGVGTGDTAPSRRLHVLRAADYQLRLGYDSSSYLDVGADATGDVRFNAIDGTATNPTFSFNAPTTITNNDDSDTILNLTGTNSQSGAYISMLTGLGNIGMTIGVSGSNILLATAGGLRGGMTMKFSGDHSDAAGPDFQFIAEDGSPFYHTLWTSVSTDIMTLWNNGDLTITGDLTAAGIGTGALVITDTSTPQLTVRYDGSNYLTVSVAADGDTTFGVDGGDVLTMESGGQVGIGTTSPSYKLHVVGGITADNGNFYSTNGASGTAAAFRSDVSGDSYTRFYMDVSGKMEWSDGAGSHDVSLYRNAANHLRTNDLFEADGGFTTEAAGASLIMDRPSGDPYILMKAAGTVVAQIRGDVTDGDGIIIADGDYGSGGVIRAKFNSAGGWVLRPLTVQGTTQPQLYVNYDADTYFTVSINSVGDTDFSVDGTDIMTLENTTFDVGIGTVSPTSRLHVLKAAANQFRVGYDTSNHFIVDVASDGDTIFKVDGNNIMTLESGGDVGFGITTPTYAIHARRTSSSCAIKAESNFASGYGRLIADGARVANGDVGVVEFMNDGTIIAAVAARRIGADDAGELRFRTRTASGSATDRMVIDENGWVAIGKTNPSTNINFEVYNDSGNAACRIRADDADANDAYFDFYADQSIDGDFAFLRFINGNSGTDVVGAIVAYRETSDDRGGFKFRTDNGSGLVNVLRIDKDQITYIGDGGSTNYSKFEADGTLEFNGAATVWDDYVVAMGPNNWNGASNNPTLTKMADDGAGSQGVYAYVFADGDEAVMIVQIPHGWKEGTTIHPHIHFACMTDVSPADNFDIEFEYWWADVGEDFPANTTMETVTISTGVNSQFMHQAGDVTAAGIDGSGHTISSVLLCRMARRAADSDNYAGGVAILDFDVHFEIDTVGSRTEWTK